MTKTMIWRIMMMVLGMAAAPVAAATLSVEKTVWVLNTDDGRRLASPQLVGAVFEMLDPDGNPATIRIYAVAPAAERPEVLLHSLSAKGPDGVFRPVCDPDIHGRRTAFPVSGAIDALGHYAKVPGQWFLTCTAGSQGKCILWGYDPWTQGPHGQDLSLYYQACQNLVRAAYDGRGVAHTRNGTSIDIWDKAGIQRAESMADPAYAFEAGWGPDGAVCVARTRWTNLLPLSVLLASAPQLKADLCDEAEARRRGAVLFNRSKLNP